VELSTLFQFVAVSWEDIDLPLSYEYSQDSSGYFTVFRARDRIAFTSGNLPRGNFRIRLNVYDNYDCKNSVSQIVNVSKSSSSSSVSSSELSSLVRSSVDSNDEGLLSTLMLANQIVNSNSVDCSSSPDCNVLNRKECLSVSNTCGSCDEGYFGVMGDSNTLCISNSVSLFILIFIFIHHCPLDQFARLLGQIVAQETVSVMWMVMKCVIQSLIAVK